MLQKGVETVIYVLWKGISNIFIAKPNEVCTMTYVVANVFDSEIEAKNFIKYMRTKIFNLMLSIYTITQDINKNKFHFVPDQQDYTKEYTDEYLYEKYGLTEEEIKFIENKFK